MNENEKMTGETQLLDTTKVDQIEVNIDDLFGMPGAESIMLPSDQTEEDKPKSIFSKENIDISFLDNSKATFSEKKEAEEKNLEVEETIAELDGLISQEEDAGNKGRPKVDKSGLSELTAKMIEEGSLVPFDDDKPFEEYTTKDFRELFEANFNEREKKIREDTPKEFFNSLPEELQYAAKYVADGGQDLKGLFRTLSYVEEIRELDADDENDQAEIARQYLYATGFGTSEEIEEEINDWSEHQQNEQAKAYTDNVFNTLSTGELGGVKLDKKIQSLLYSGLVQPNYPSIHGKPTNLFGHLIEKYQFVEPRHDLIAEALWLLADPEGYKGKVREQGSKIATEKVVRQLKSEESRKIGSSISEEEEVKKNTSYQRNTQRTIPRQNNMFKRGF